MSLASKLLSASGGGADKLYVDDVFSAYTYTGNASTQTINNGIDLAGKGGMVWIKRRDINEAHAVFDTARGAGKGLSTNSVNAPGASGGVGYDLDRFDATGFRLGSSMWNSDVNTTGGNYASWTFRKAPKFFDVVTYTGNGASSRAITHLLGQEVGMVMTKATSTAGDWNTYHRSATGDLVLNTTAAQTGSKVLVNSATATTFTVSGAANTNAVTYVAYLFAHDSSADGIVQCGSFTEPAGGTFSVELGWEPQFVVVKEVSRTGDWVVLDQMRGWSQNSIGDVGNRLFANSANSENTGTTSTLKGPHATGFHRWSNWYEGTRYIYLAIRRPNKPPTTGTEVYNAIARTGTGAAATVTGVGFAPDLMATNLRGSGGSKESVWFDRLRGKNSELFTAQTDAELTADPSALTGFDVMGGVALGSSNGGYGVVNILGRSYINHFFKRAPGVFDVVCYTGTGVARTVPHSLGVAPELMIVKGRTNAQNWAVYSSTVGPAYWLRLDQTADAIGTNSTLWNNTAPTSTQFTVGTTVSLNDTAILYVAYLFASRPGISKVGSYTGNGTSQTIDCGFTTGARFVMIKRTDAAGDWYVWDTVRGLVAGNDPHLSLNSTTAEITTDDSLDPASVGFIVNQLAATNINVASASYIYLSFA